MPRLFHRLKHHRLLLLAACALAVSFATHAPAPYVGAYGVVTLPGELSDSEFSQLLTDFSEPDGYFRSDNLLSNEIFFQYVIPDLTRNTRRDGVYLGVGPEQNFTYIAAIRPRMAFVVDVRRGNLHLQLMYKAIFELSEDRAGFVARLFSKPRPPGLGPASSAHDIFAALTKVDRSEALFQANARDIRNHLVRTRNLDLDETDLRAIEAVYYQFFWFGPAIQYWSTSGGRGARNAPSYMDLMVANDGKGEERSFLSSEERFGILKRLHSKNLVVPVVGNFAGPKALRAVGKYLKQHNAFVSAFYISNVEQYLNRDGLWSAFCTNVALLPLDPASTFIRSVRNGMYGAGVGLDSVLGNMLTEVESCR
jgi:hypothetical protein